MVEWLVSKDVVAYPQALAAMETRVGEILGGQAAEQVWLLEHPPIYTAGTSAGAGELLPASPFPVYETGRGGRYTYHGPGQRVAYVLLDLRTRGRDLRQHVWRLEEWLIRTLADFDVVAERRAGRIGLWVAAANGECKIAAVGVRVRGWVTFHGVSLNVHPDLSHFGGIVPCGLADFGVTSLAALGKDVSLAAVDAALQRRWDAVFGIQSA